MELNFLNTYNKGLTKIDGVLVALSYIVKIELAFTDTVNVSVNRPLEIKSLKLVTLIDGSTHYVSSKNLEVINVLDSEYYLKD